MEFLALDVETANADMASICQISLVRFANGLVIDEFSTYLDPESEFDQVNVMIHGIRAETVRGSPKLSDICDELGRMMHGKIIVTHTPFDRVALARAYQSYGACPVRCRWLDSARVVRRAWHHLAWAGYGLKNVCRELKIEFRHHNALEDARAAGRIMLAAIEQTGIDAEAWLRRVSMPIDLTKAQSPRVKLDRDPDGPLYGGTLAFTGSLQIPRREAAEMAAKLGCAVASNVSRKLTILVVGDQDVTRLAGHDRSAKHRKVEDLILDGCPIRILRETDFLELVSNSALSH
ncbi:exonuclease domain-containing protein [Salinarimonas sp.]|uniref:exonuclease domain-containing protein n=1 Tax=Salinarimonas sp. TaxID=2766526 RepID=UPI0032D9857B